MERDEISQHEVNVFASLERHKTSSVNSDQVAKEASVAPRGARPHLLKLVRLTLVDRLNTLPAHRYRLSSNPKQRHREYPAQLARACATFKPPISAVPVPGRIRKISAAVARP
jgi:hypothetical protein